MSPAKMANRSISMRRTSRVKMTVSIRLRKSHPNRATTISPICTFPPPSPTYRVRCLWAAWRRRNNSLPRTTTNISPLPPIYQPHNQIHDYRPGAEGAYSIERETFLFLLYCRLIPLDLFFFGASFNDESRIACIFNPSRIPVLFLFILSGWYIWGDFGGICWLGASL